MPGSEPESRTGPRKARCCACWTWWRDRNGSGADSLASELLRFRPLRVSCATNQVRPRSTATRRSRATPAQANSRLEPCQPACTSSQRWKNLPLCGAGRHEPSSLRCSRPAVPIRELSTSCLLHPTTSRRARGLNPWADGRPEESRGIVASSWERV